MKILIMSDSLALAREKPEQVLYEETWPALLKNKGHDVLQVCIGGGTSEDLLRQVTYHKHYRPDIVIIQVGIVDCAPRHFSKLEIQLLRKIPFFGKFVLKYFNKPFLRKIRKISYVSITRFKRNIIDLKYNFYNTKILFVGIIPASNGFETILPGVSKNINEYNHILATIALDDFIDMEWFPNEGVMSDYHHLNQTGHKALYKKIADFLTKIEDKST